MQLGSNLGKLKILWSQQSRAMTMRSRRDSVLSISFSYRRHPSYSSATARPFTSPTCNAAASTQQAENIDINIQSSNNSTNSNIVQVLRSRGLLQEITSPELEAAAIRESLLVYCGFDPTADSLHLGNLLGIIVLSWFQRCGHRPVALLGGATGRVGDPSGKSAERPVLSEASIEANTAAIERTLRHLLTPPTKNLPEPLVVNNLDWFGPMPLLSFLRDIGKFARVGTMIAKESVRKRMESESGISYTEFTYQLLQGYDFVHMAREMGVKVQVGGSDQWGNIIAGTDLVRRMLGKEESNTTEDSNNSVNKEEEQCFGLTFPLLLKSDGSKFGKSESGAVWLSPEKLSAYEFYQFLLKTTDADVPKFLKMLTFLPLEEIDAIERAMQASDYIPNTAQKRLAEEVTRFVRGEEGLAQALNATAALAPGSSGKLDAATLEAAAADAPSAVLSRDQIIGQPLADILVAAGMQPSKAAGRRMIKGGGIRVNNVKIEDEGHLLSEDDLIEGRLMLLAAGKKNKTLVKVE
jgi:tyrosyl-tRNA synthetase